MSVKLEVDTEEFKEAMKRKAEATEKMKQFFKTEGLGIVKEEMEIVTPVLTGHLRASIRSKETPKGFFVHPSAIYARKIERKYGFVLRAYYSALTKLRTLIDDLIGDLVGES